MLKGRSHPHRMEGTRRRRGKNQLVPGILWVRSSAMFVEDCRSQGYRTKYQLTQSRVFKAFVSTKVSGSGLGLTVARDIVESHGGIVLVGSLSNRGNKCSKFFCRALRQSLAGILAEK